MLFEIRHSRKSNPVIVHADNLKSFQIRKTARLKLKHLLKIKEIPEKTSETPKLDPSSTSKETAESPRMRKVSAPKTNRGPCITAAEPPPTDQSRDTQTRGTSRETRRGRAIRKPKRYEDSLV